ncbi:TetR/AcrR family transcriptional regulator [Micromonospora sp. WMMD1102]|uniref:TetR/AcrR family transcriptional regulator n=1 Tax=Micromonospora sp. WMMD1102 TaxID=3016105 RepID=UPI002414DE78|nr:TetR/AcrR family transcriptional regulator [Micromonospora sp. WMMD1102]MDG4787922.1 TetR/AcrR family transcriptional regulator [Micromonospora sp. WMMD1102]
MSEPTGARSRRRRSDADRSAAAVLAAAVEVLGRNPGAKVEQVAVAAGVTRQTVYAHYPSRPLLLGAVVARITDEAVAALDAADVDSGTATEALLRWLDATWRLLDRYPLLLDPAVTVADPAEDDRRHAPVVARLARLVRRGQASGEFDRTTSPAWLVSATVALGHAAGGEVAAGRATTAEAAAALCRSILRVYGVRQP